MQRLVLIVQCYSTVALFIECCVVFRAWKDALHSYLFLSCAATFVNNVGYLLELMARSEDAYITALRFSYLGRVWISYALLYFVVELVQAEIPRLIKPILASISVATYLIFFTTARTGLYYKTTQFTDAGGVLKLHHDNGVWYYVWWATLVFSVICGMYALLTAWRREKDARVRSRLLMVIIAVLAESACVFIQMEKLFPVTEVYDVTMIGYTIGTIFMFHAILRYDLLYTETLARDYVVDQLSEAILAVDESGSIRYYNAPARRLLSEFGLSAQEALDGLRTSIRSGEPLRVRDRIFNPQANDLILEGAVAGTIYSVTDDTDHYRYMDELREQRRLADEANRAKSAFLANMSHEIRTPINAILGMDEMILRESEEKDILGYAENIESAGRSLLSIINDILDLSKIEEGRMEILPVQYDLSSLVNDLANMTRERAASKGLRFVMRVDESIPHILVGDEIRIRECALNLLTNAVKYTEKGLVTLDVSYEKLDEDHIVLHISVADTGIGMKPESLELLFEPFTRIDELRNRNIEGSGLGMAITKQLLDLMDSQLDVESVYGEGSTFSFALVQPVARWEPIGSFGSRYETNAPHRLYHELFHAPEARILVVDDTPVNLSVFCGLLKRTKMKIDTADSGAHALEKAAAQRYDVIFIDHMMPEMDGIETLRRLRALPELKDVPCVALTANAISGAREMYLQNGFSDYLSKPVDGYKLEKLLLNFLPAEKAERAPDSEAAEAPAALPDWLLRVEGLSTDRGLLHCGTEETYLDTLAIYAKNAAAAADEIEAYWRAGDLENTTTKVHALKSMSRAIGAERLGTLAEKLEYAGRDGDTQTLRVELDGLLRDFRALGAALAPLAGGGETAEDAALPPITEAELREAWDSLRELAANFDSDNAQYVLDYLAGYRIPPEERKRAEGLRRAIASFDWEQAAALLK